MAVCQPYPSRVDLEVFNQVSCSNGRSYDRSPGDPTAQIADMLVETPCTPNTSLETKDPDRYCCTLLLKIDSWTSRTHF